MFDRDFEVFLIKHLRREGAMYCGVLIAIGSCSIACIVMAIAALIVYGLKGLSTSLKLVSLGLGFAGGCYGILGIVRSNREACREMVEKLENPVWIIPEDYSDETKAARRSVCEILKHICGLVISYGILSLTLWAACALFIALSGIGTSDFSLMMLLLAIVMLAMALPLTILMIAYMLDLPKAHKYKKSVNSVLMEETNELTDG